MARDFYDVLGVSRSASDKEVRQAFRRLARKYHPDVNPGDAKAEERFKEINRAYEVLSDADKRKKYDRYGERWEQAEAFDLGDLFGRGGGGGPFEGIFEAFTGRRGPMRGQNVEYAAEVTLEEASQGTTRLLQMQSEEACATCGGTGQIAGAVCHVCQGAGAVVRPKRIEVKIPAGVQDGSRVRIAGEGHPPTSRGGAAAALRQTCGPEAAAAPPDRPRVPPLRPRHAEARGRRPSGEEQGPRRPPRPRARRPAGVAIRPRARAVRAPARGAP